MLCFALRAFLLGPGVEAEVGAIGITSPTYTYTFEKCIMIKAGISGALISQEKGTNAKFYGVDKSPSEIVLEPGSVTIPEGNSHLDEFYKKLGSINDTAE